MGCFESALRIVFHFTWCLAQGITYKVVLQAVVDPQSQETIFSGCSAMQGRPKMDPPAQHRPAIECGACWPGSASVCFSVCWFIPLFGPSPRRCISARLGCLKHRARAVAAQVVQKQLVFCGKCLVNVGKPHTFPW